MKIQPLYEVPHHARQVTDWLWQAFGGVAMPREFFASIVEHSQTPGALPLTFVLTDGGRLLATVGLWRCDLMSRQDLFPWLAALYVDEAARGQGLAGMLQEYVKTWARREGHAQLHLYSACLGFYERYGWQHIGEGIEFPATTVHLYRTTL